MALREIGDVDAARAFVSSGEGDDLIQDFQKFDWKSFNFADEEIWPQKSLSEFAFRLAGGRYTTTGRPGVVATLEVFEEDSNLYESFVNIDRQDLLELIKEAYCGSNLALGVPIAVLCGRANRCWSARADEAEGRASVGKCMDGFTLREGSGSSMRPLASTLNRMGLRSKLGPFAGSGVQASTTKKRLLNFFQEFAPPTTVNGLICLAASHEDCLNLLVSNWNEDMIQDLDIPEAVAICSAMGLSPTSSGSAPRFLALTFKEKLSEGAPASSPNEVPFREALAVPTRATVRSRSAPVKVLPPSLSASLHQQKKVGATPQAMQKLQEIVQGDDSGSD